MELILIEENIIHGYEIYITKSRLMLFLRCPRKFRKIILEGHKQESSNIMLNGTVLHTHYEELLKEIDEFKLSSDFNNNYNYIRSLLPSKKNYTIDNIAMVEADRATKTHFSLFRPVFSEQKYKTVFCEEIFFEKYNDYRTVNILNILTKEQLDELKFKYKISPIITLNGKIDHLFLDEENNFIIHEFKSGSFNSGSQSKIRKELVLYKVLIDPHLCKPIEKLSYFFANEDEYHIEKIQKRTVTGLKNSIFKYITTNIEQRFESKYFGNACDNNCQFWKECKVLNVFR